MREPLAQGRVASLARVLGGLEPDQPPGALALTGGDRVLDSAVEVVVRRVPLARALVQDPLEPGAAAAQLRLEHLLQQRVVTVLVVATVEGHEQHVRPRHAPQRLRRALALEDRVAQRAEEAIEEGGPGEEVALGFGEPGEEGIADVVGDETVVAVEIVDRHFDVVRGAQREGREVQPGRPALGVLDQALDGGAVELEPGLLEQVGGLARGHHQVARPDLAETALGPQPAERDLGFLA
jgi:hypothetical protein